MHNIQPASTFGALHFDDPRILDRPLTEKEEIQQALAKLDEAPLPPPPISDWIPIIDCISRGEGFSLDARNLVHRASLRFDPNASQLGDYEIQFLGQHRSEKGTVLKVTRIGDEDLWIHQFAALGPFPTRFIVTTNASHGIKRLWFVGITSVRQPDIESNADITEIPDTSAAN